MTRETILISGLGLASILFAMSLASFLAGPAPVSAPPVQQASAPAAAPPAMRGGMAPGGGMPDEATIRARVQQLRDRLTENPNDVEGWRMLGRSHMALGEYREAVEAWSWVRELAPNDPQANAALQQLQAIAEQGGRHPPVGGR